MKILISLFTVATLVSASNYEGCSDTEQKAKIVLSGNIVSNIETDFVEKGDSKSSLDEESVDFSISSYTHVSSNLSLVDIKYKKSGDEVCAYIDSKKQVENINNLLKKVSLYDEKNLPKDIDKKLDKLTIYLNDIKQLNYLMPVFLKDTKEYEKNLTLLNKKEKIFQDLYTDTLAKSEESVWKTCSTSKDEAKKSLNSLLFKEKRKKETDIGRSFLNLLNPLKWFDNSEKDFINHFSEQITYIKQDSKECAIIKKDDLKSITYKMVHNKNIFNKFSLSTNPKVRYNQLKDYIYQINVTNSLMALFPNIYSETDFNRINKYKNYLESLKKTTYPQFVKFNIVDDTKNTKIKIKLDDNYVKNQEELYIKDGEHSYEITANGKCPLIDNFEMNLFDDKIISEDLASQNYPTVLFISELKPNIVIAGKNIKENIQTTIKKCSGSVRYVATFAGQTQSGEIELAPNETKSIELKFLTSKELAIFNDARTQKFSSKSGVKFSSSLTPMVSKNLIFSIDDKPENGDLTLDEKGSFVYISDDGFSGIDTFSYKIEANGEDSGVKIVQIEVIAPKSDFVVERKKEIITKDEQPEIKKERKIDVVKKEKIETKNSPDKKDSKLEERYQRFKAYVESQSLNLEKLKKLQEHYPELFERLLKEKIGN